VGAVPAQPVDQTRGPRANPGNGEMRFLLRKMAVSPCVAGHSESERLAISKTRSRGDGRSRSTRFGSMIRQDCARAGDGSALLWWPASEVVRAELLAGLTAVEDVVGDDQRRARDRHGCASPAAAGRRSGRTRRRGRGPWSRRQSGRPRRVPSTAACRRAGACRIRSSGGLVESRTRHGPRRPARPRWGTGTCPYRSRR
jgi:hypothetical protein